MKTNQIRVGVVLLFMALLLGCSNYRGLTLVDKIEDGEHGAYNLEGVSDLAVGVIDGQFYLYVAAENDNAVSVFSIADNGILTFVDDVRDGERGANNLEGAFTVAARIIDGDPQKYLLVAGLGAVSIFSVADDGILTFVEDEQLETYDLNTAEELDMATIGDDIYLFAVVRDDDAVAVFRLSR